MLQKDAFNPTFPNYTTIMDIRRNLTLKHSDKFDKLFSSLKEKYIADIFWKVYPITDRDLQLTQTESTQEKLTQNKSIQQDSTQRESTQQESIQHKDVNSTRRKSTQLQLTQEKLTQHELPQNVLAYHDISEHQLTQKQDKTITTDLMLTQHELTQENLTHHELPRHQRTADEIEDESHHQENKDAHFTITTQNDKLCQTSRSSSTSSDNSGDLNTTLNFEETTVQDQIDVIVSNDIPTSLKIQHDQNVQHIQDELTWVKKKTQKFLFLYQTLYQQILLRRYGSILFITEIIPRGSRGPLAVSMYLLAVRTNVDYQVVGTILINEYNDNTKSLKCCLSRFNNWNISWKPKYLMIDSNDALVSTVKGLFQSSYLSKKVY